MYATVHLARRISDHELELVTRENPGWKIERDADGGLVMSPTTTGGSAKNMELSYQLQVYAKNIGGKAFDSSGGFTMPDTSVLSPDGAWMRQARWDALTPKLRDSYTPIVPDIWIELVSKTDNPSQLQSKLQRIRSFGAAYVLLIDPYRRTTWEDGTRPDGFSLDFEAIFDA